MRFEITASAVKSWFQYRCERKLVYDSFKAAARRAIPIEENIFKSAWAEFGNDFEAAVVRALVDKHPREVLQPSPGSTSLSEAMSLGFLKRVRPEAFAHQLVLNETPTLRALLALPDDVGIGMAIPDLIEARIDASGVVFHVIDVKATRAATVFHKAQVALYALMLRATLAECGFPGGVAEEGEIWHLPGHDCPDVWEVERFRLGGYEALVADFFAREVRGARQRRVEPSYDDTFFHIYFKCEQCKYLPHCRKTIDGESPAAWDVSAVTGMTHESKRALRDRGVTTVGALAKARGLRAQTASAPWSLRTRGDVLVARAEALVDGRCLRLPDRYSWLLPPRVDVALHLVADRDPVDGNLVALGCLTVWPDRDETVISVIRDGAHEGAALRQVLGRVVQVLADLHAYNHDRPETEGRIAHIFLYEAAEARDLQEALGRHLDDEMVRGGLLQLIRIFPPEEVVAAEPEYRGIHHLPATALRSAVEQLYALPVKVAHDLGSVTRALAGATPPLNTPYVPAPGFEHPFSSRLSIDVMRALRSGSGDEAAVRRDVEARLQAMHALVRWILADNARSESPFLRLRKKPFRFQAAFHPLEATDLEILMSHELLAARSALLTTLTELARPARERRDRLRCFANMKLVHTHPAGRTQRMRFWVPPESRQAELASTTFGLILTNDDADLRLDPTRWRDVRVSITSDLDSGQHLEVEMARQQFQSPFFDALRRETPENGWFLDEIYVDLNTDRAVNFLRSLATVAS